MPSAPLTELCTPTDHRLSRRRWLGGLAGLAAGGAAGLTGLPALPGLGLSRLVSAAESPKLNPARRQVIFLWLDGGISQLESWDPKPGTRFGGPFRSIATTVPGVHFSELAPRTARLMNRLTLVRSLCTQDNSHSAGVARIQRGDPKNRGVPYPFLGSAVAKLLGDGGTGLPPYVWIKPGNGGFIHSDAGFLGPKYGAVAFGDGRPPENMTRPADLPSEADDARNALREKLAGRYTLGRRPEVGQADSHVFGMARELMRRQELFDLSRLPAAELDRYGRCEFGRHVLLARRMIEAGVTFVKVASYGWDTHGDNFNGHADMVPKVDRAFAALIEDLASTGRLANTLVVLMSEFGRTPRINGHAGRDHWPEAWSALMAGAGLVPGAVHGATDAEGIFVKDGQVDIGHLFHTWFRCVGVDPAKTEYDNAGQPLPIAHDDCKPISAILA